MSYHLWMGLLKLFSHSSSHVDDFLPFFYHATMYRPCLENFMGVSRAIPCSVLNHNGQIHREVLA